MNHSLAAAAFATLLACSSSASDDGTHRASDLTLPPMTVLTSDTGGLSIAVRTAPYQPPTRGESSVQFTITDAKGAPATGLLLDVVPWMPAMGHGTSVTPTVAVSGPGVYLLTQVDLFMAGTWDLRVGISGTATDRVRPSFQIP